MVEVKLYARMKASGITIYRLAKLTGMRYELLRRVFCGERKLTANELVTILNMTGISFDEIK